MRPETAAAACAQDAPRDASPPATRARPPAAPPQVVFTEASRRAGRTIDRVVSIMDASGLTLAMLSGFAQRVRIAWHTGGALCSGRSAPMPPACTP